MLDTVPHGKRGISLEELSSLSSLEKKQKQKNKSCSQAFAGWECQPKR